MWRIEVLRRSWSGIPSANPATETKAVSIETTVNFIVVPIVAKGRRRAGTGYATSEWGSRAWPPYDVAHAFSVPCRHSWRHVFSPIHTCAVPLLLDQVSRSRHSAAVVFQPTLEIPVETQLLPGHALCRPNNLAGVLGEMIDNVTDGVERGHFISLNAPYVVSRSSSVSAARTLSASSTAPRNTRSSSSRSIGSRRANSASRSRV